ncbi:MAG: hypothetical protein ACRCT8_03890 [Lacipirellulaceae bacterium]
MKSMGVVAKILTQLSLLPGLAFLRNYVLEAHSTKVRLSQQKTKYEAWIAAGGGAIQDADEAIRGPSRGGPASGGRPAGPPEPSPYDSRLPPEDDQPFDDKFYDDDYGRY